MADMFTTLRAVSSWVDPCLTILRDHMVEDTAHDEAHLYRVASRALHYGADGNTDVLIIAGLLHDLVNVPKDHPDRNKASLLSADKALALLASEYQISLELGGLVHHAIHAHSFSANVRCTTIEAMAVQDADRIESLGALGLARLFAVSGSMGRSLFHAADPLAEDRELDQYAYAIDHAALKLGGLRMAMQTPRGKVDAVNGHHIILDFLIELLKEIDFNRFGQFVETHAKADYFLTQRATQGRPQ